MSDIEGLIASMLDLVLGPHKDPHSDKDDHSTSQDGEQADDTHLPAFQPTVVVVLMSVLLIKSDLKVKVRFLLLVVVGGRVQKRLDKHLNLSDKNGECGVC